MFVVIFVRAAGGSGGFAQSTRRLALPCAPGAVIAVGSDVDVQVLFLALAALPDLRLLTTSPRAMRLRAVLNMANYSQASRFHYPYGQEPACWCCFFFGHFSP